MHTKKFLILIFILALTLSNSAYCYRTGPTGNTPSDKIFWRIKPDPYCAQFFARRDTNGGAAHSPNLLWKEQGDTQEYVDSRYRWCTFTITAHRANGKPVKHFSVKTSTWEAYVGDRYWNDRRFQRRVTSMGRTKVVIKLPIFYEGCVYNTFRFGVGKHPFGYNNLSYSVVGLTNYRCDV